MLSTITRVYPNAWPARPASGHHQEGGVLSLTGAPARIQEGGLTVQPVLQMGGSSFGAEVSGVDWSRPIPEATVKQVRVGGG